MVIATAPINHPNQIAFFIAAWFGLVWLDNGMANGYSNLFWACMGINGKIKVHVK